MCDDMGRKKVFAIFDRAILLNAGRVIYSGPAGEVRDSHSCLYFKRSLVLHEIIASSSPTIAPNSLVIL